MKPVDRSKLTLSLIAGALIAGAAGVAYLHQPEKDTIVPAPELTLPPAPAPPVITPPPPVIQTTPGAETPHHSLKEIARRLRAGIQHERELNFQAQQENRSLLEDPLRKKIVFEELSRIQRYQRDRSRRTLLLMKALEPNISLPKAQKAVEAAVEQMDQATGFFDRFAVQEAVSHGRQAIRHLEAALTVVSRP
jgi:hypothetical protein